jgi:hypothetical protein
MSVDYTSTPEVEILDVDQTMRVSRITVEVPPWFDQDIPGHDQALRDMSVDTSAASEVERFSPTTIVLTYV